MIENLKKTTVLLIIILLIQYLFIGCIIKKNDDDLVATTSNRKIFTGYEIGVNYVTHIYTLANAGFEDDEYVKKFGDTISKEDLLFIKENAELMQFSQGINGKFADIFYFIPAYNNFKNEKEWKNYFLAWGKSIKENREDYVKSYCIGYMNEDIYHLYQNVDDETWNKKVKRIGDIYTENFETYKTKVWPKIETELKKKSEELNKYLSDFPYIDKWEEVTGYKFGDNDYYVALFYAGKDGPSWNNVSLYKNTAFFDSNKEFMLDMLSHELGIHIMISDIRREIEKFESQGVSHNVLYNALEMLATFYNEKVQDRPGNDVNYEYNKQFFKIYSNLYEEGTTKPIELFIKGVSEYIKNDI